jgi:hypothetical protein
VRNLAENLIFPLLTWVKIETFASVNFIQAFETKQNFTEFPAHHGALQQANFTGEGAKFAVRVYFTPKHAALPPA